MFADAQRTDGTPRIERTAAHVAAIHEAERNCALCETRPAEYIDVRHGRELVCGSCAHRENGRDAGIAVAGLNTLQAAFAELAAVMTADEIVAVIREIASDEPHASADNGERTTLDLEPQGLPHWTNGLEFDARFLPIEGES